jgi:hypothetical protein
MQASPPTSGDRFELDFSQVLAGTTDSSANNLTAFTAHQSLSETAANLFGPAAPTTLPQARCECSGGRSGYAVDWACMTRKSTLGSGVLFVILAE